MHSPLTVQPEADSSIRQAIQQALASLLSVWSEIGDRDVVIYSDKQPKAAIIPFADYQRLQVEGILQDIRDGREAQTVYEEWLDNPELARPYAEFRAEMIDERLLDE